MRKQQVEIIIGGVQKGGTTSLFRYLQGHSALLAPRQLKELHFFDDETLDWSKPQYEFLHGAFSDMGTGRKAFEATPIYLFWPPSLERIRSYNSEMKLIFLFRDPIERAWSQWKMEINRRRETLPFHVAIRGGRQRLQNCGSLDRQWRLFSYVERGFYFRQVQNALRLFPREQLLFLRSNDLRNDHLGTLRTIAEFLGIDEFPDMAARLDHRTQPVAYRLNAIEIEFLRGIFYQDVLAFSKLTGLAVSDWPTINPAVAIAR
jgi:Sulfotransferase domain